MEKYTKLLRLFAAAWVVSAFIVILWAPWNDYTFFGAEADNYIFHIYVLFLALASYLWNTLITPPPKPAPDSLRFKFNGNVYDYFKIALSNAILTVATLGAYSAWAKVRARRWFYGCTTLDGVNFDYHANPKSILAARVVVLVVYIVLGTGALLWVLRYFDIEYDFFLLMGDSAWADYWGGYWHGLLFVLLVFFYAWATARGSAFNARYSSFHNARFSFHGDSRSLLIFAGACMAISLAPPFFNIWTIVEGFDKNALVKPPNPEAFVAKFSGVYNHWDYPLKMALLFVPPFALIAAFPAALRGFIKWRVSNHRLGKIRFRHEVPLSRYYFYFLLLPSPLLLPVLDAVASQMYPARGFGVLAQYWDFAMWQGWSEGSMIVSTRMQGFVTSFYVIIAASVSPVLFYGGIAFDGGRFRCSVTAAEYMIKILAPNFLAVLFSLGLLWPWARVRRAKYLAENI